MKIAPRLIVALDDDGEPYIEFFGDPKCRVFLLLGDKDNGWSTVYVDPIAMFKGEIPEELRKGLKQTILQWNGRAPQPENARAVAIEKAAKDVVATALAGRQTGRRVVAARYMNQLSGALEMKDDSVTITLEDLESIVSLLAGDNVDLDEVEQAMFGRLTASLAPALDARAKGTP